MPMTTPLSFAWGLILIDWRHRDAPKAIRQLRGPRDPVPDAAYALLKLCHLPDKIDREAVPLTPWIVRRAVAGDLAGATTLAARRLRSSGLTPAVEVIYGHAQRARRIAAALMFPVWHSETTDRMTDARQLKESCCRVDPSEADEDVAEEAGRQAATT